MPLIFHTKNQAIARLLVSCFRSKQFALEKLFSNSKKKQTSSCAFASGKTEIYFFLFSSLPFPSFPTNKNCYFIAKPYLYVFCCCELLYCVHGMVYGWFWTIHLFHFTMCMFFKEFSSFPSSSSPWYSSSRQLMVFVLWQKKKRKKKFNNNFMTLWQSARSNFFSALIYAKENTLKNFSHFF